MNDEQKIILRGFANEMEKDAALPRIVLKGLAHGKNALKSGKKSAKAFKDAFKGNKMKVTKGNPASRAQEIAYGMGDFLGKNKKNIGLAGGGALGGAGLNEIFDD